MARQSRERSAMNCYHITTRGVGRQMIFEDSSDKMCFLSRMDRFKRETEVELLSYCLMDNHIHLLVSAEMENISMCMKKIEDSYTLMFNRKYDRVGSLFQGRFGSKAIISQNNLYQAIRYIHKNPEKAGMCMASDYVWSSYDEFANSACICDLNWLNEIIGGKEGFIEIMRENDSDDEEIAIPYSSQLSDPEALIAAERLVTHNNLREMRLFPKKARNEMLVLLYNEGLSIRQIESITGISRGIVQYAVSGVSKKRKYI